MPKMTGARFIAKTVHGYGITHVFFMPYIGPRALMEMENAALGSLSGFRRTVTRKRRHTWLMRTLA